MLTASPPLVPQQGEESSPSPGERDLISHKPSLQSQLCHVLAKRLLRQTRPLSGLSILTWKTGVMIIHPSCGQGAPPHPVQTEQQGGMLVNLEAVAVIIL